MDGRQTVQQGAGSADHLFEKLSRVRPYVDQPPAACGLAWMPCCASSGGAGLLAVPANQVTHSDGI